jgi:acetoin:2,6-dichlorophenolindophenol oxidoreductase subunit alpha
MRSPTFNVIDNLAETFGKDIHLDIFRKIITLREFEKGLIAAIEKKHVTIPVYLSTGQEAIAAAMSIAIPGHMIFSQHRCHATYLAFGGDPTKLRDEFLGLPTGTSGGRAGSNCLQSHDDGMCMWGHHGLIGENVPLGVGAAMGSGKPTVCFFGDGAAEEDYVFASMGFAATHKLPVLFVCDDNNLSILTPISVRRNWNMPDVAKGFGLPSVEISDDPWTIIHEVKKLDEDMPGFINIHTCRGRWHVGIGTDGPPEWDRFAMIRETLNNLGLKNDIDAIEADTKKAMEELWNV